MTTKKNSILRKGIILTIILATVLSFSVPSLAALPEDNTVEPRWYNMNMINLYFVFSGNDGTACSEVIQKANATLIEATLTVYRKEGFRWVTVASNSGSSSMALCLDVEFNAIEGATYKMVLDVTAYGISVDETESLSKTETYE